MKKEKYFFDYPLWWIWFVLGFSIFMGIATYGMGMSNTFSESVGVFSLIFLLGLCFGVRIKRAMFVEKEDFKFIGSKDDITGKMEWRGQRLVIRVEKMDRFRWWSCYYYNDYQGFVTNSLTKRSAMQKAIKELNKYLLNKMKNIF
jgi:hypothetical protein